MSPSKPVRPLVVVAKSAQLRFRLAAKTAPAPLLLLSKPDPLALGSGLAGGFAAAYGRIFAKSAQLRFRGQPFGFPRKLRPLPYSAASVFKRFAGLKAEGERGFVASALP